jgi:hypothetical protein
MKARFWRGEAVLTHDFIVHRDLFGSHGWLYVLGNCVEDVYVWRGY